MSDDKEMYCIAFEGGDPQMVLVDDKAGLLTWLDNNIGDAEGVHVTYIGFAKYADAQSVHDRAEAGE